MVEVQLLAQALALLFGNVYHLLWALVDLPFALLRCCVPRRQARGAQGATFYEGEVVHHRRYPTSNKFTWDPLAPAIPSGRDASRPPPHPPLPPCPQLPCAHGGRQPGLAARLVAGPGRGPPHRR
jgi:hypothetical protein